MTLIIAVHREVLVDSLDQVAIRLEKITHRVCVGDLIIIVGGVDGLEAAVVIAILVGLGLHVASMVVLSVGALGSLIRLTAVVSLVEGMRF